MKKWTLRSKFWGLKAISTSKPTRRQIAIKRIQPTLNEDEGRYISPIFDPVPSKFTRSRLVSQADDVTSDGSNGARSYGDAIMNHF